MDSDDITRVLRNNALTRRYFCGVYAANRLPLIPLNRPSFVIANTDDDTRPGTHWVCFYMPIFGTGVHYFDSLGNPPQVPNFLRFIALNGGLYSSCYRQIQSVYSDVCGEFCCTFVLYCSMGYSLVEFKQLFRFSYPRNDHLLVERFNESFTCSSHFKRPTLRAIHAQSCAPLCHVGRRRCPAEIPSPHAPTRRWRRHYHRRTRPSATAASPPATPTPAAKRNP